VIQLIPGSQEVFRRFQEVNHMMKPPTALFHPAVLRPVLRRAIGLKRREAPRPQEAPARSAAGSATTSSISVTR
jgi:hypothetical protein